VVLPATVSDVGSMIALAMSVIGRGGNGGSPAGGGARPGGPAATR
jgi:hypothetical protein